MINIEGNYNFYEELKKQLNNNTNNDSEVNHVIDNQLFKDNINDGKCLITNEKLTKGYVTLSCSHSFNYVPLYNDLVNHKKSLSLETQYLKSNEIRCPYCRNKQVGLLPYYECMGVKKTNGVNYIKKTGVFVGDCHYKELMTSILSKNYKGLDLHFSNNSEEENEEYIICSNMVSRSSIDNKCYCSKHKMKATVLLNRVKKYEMKMKALKEKEDKKIAKMNAKINSENVIININYCSVIVRSGKNKGKHCSYKVYNGQLCKRHFLLQKDSISNLLDELNEMDESNQAEYSDSEKI
jgi:hypothetical protein